LQDKDQLFEIDGRKIRSTKRDFSPVNKADSVFSPPKLLFKAVKRKAYPVIVKSGLVPGAKEHIVMTTDRDLALRMAQRLDQRPIILEIRAHAANDNGIPFYTFGESLYVSDRIPAQFINGPPLPEDPSEKKGPVKKERETTPGSFILRVENDPDLKRRIKAKKRIGWKQEGKKGKGGKRLTVRKAGSSQHFGY
jgi:putative RNA 2'-phosphotransferase